MSERAITWAQDQLAPTSTAKFLLMRLAAYADVSGVVWAFVERLADEMQTTDRTVQRSLRALCNVGLIELTGKFHYRNVPYYRLPLERPGQGRTVTPASPLAGSNGDTSVTVENANGDMGVTPTVTPASPQSIEPTSEGKPSSERGRAREPDHFRLAWDGSPDAMRRGRSSQRLGRQAWDAEAASGHAPKALAAAVRAYAADRAAWGASGAPVAFHRFLSEGRFEGYLPAAGAAAAEAVRTPFVGPPGLREAFAAKHTEATAATWLDHCEWDAAECAILARNGFAAEEVSKRLRGLREAAGVKVQVLVSRSEFGPISIERE